MRHWRKPGWAAATALALGLGVPAAAWAAPPCDEYDPYGPARSAQIRLGPADFVDEDGDELRSFIATDSIGRVEVSVAASSGGAVRSVTAVPEISMFSRYYGEQLKGINVAVSVDPSRRPASVVLNLSQVCAKHFRNTFLYY